MTWYVAQERNPDPYEREGEPLGCLSETELMDLIADAAHELDRRDVIDVGIRQAGLIITIQRVGGAPSARPGCQPGSCPVPGCPGSCVFPT